MDQKHFISVFVNLFSFDILKLKENEVMLFTDNDIIKRINGFKE